MFFYLLFDVFHDLMKNSIFSIDFTPSVFSRPLIKRFIKFSGVFACLQSRRIQPRIAKMQKIK